MINRCLVARAGIEPATFFPLFGLTFGCSSVFRLLKAVLGHRIERPGATGPVVWPRFGPLKTSDATAEGMGAAVSRRRRRSAPSGELETRQRTHS